MNFRIVALFFVSAVLTAGQLADFSGDLSGFRLSQNAHGLSMSHVTGQGKRYLCLTGNAGPQLTYAELILKKPRLINIADEFEVETEIFLPEKNGILIAALQIVDARGKIYVFERGGLSVVSPGAHNLLYKFTPAAKKTKTAKKYGAMKFPVKFRGLCFLFGKAQTESSRNSICVGKVNLTKGEDDFAPAWLSVRNKIHFSDILHHSSPVLRNVSMKMLPGCIQLDLGKGKSIFETKKRNNRYQEIYRVKLDLDLRSGNVSADPVIIDAAGKKNPCRPAALKSGRHTYLFEVTPDEKSKSPFHFGIEFTSEDSGARVDLHDVLLEIPMRAVDGIKVGKTSQPAGMITPETKDKQASISFRNDLSEKTQADITLVLRDSFQKIKTENHKLALAPGESRTFRMPEMKRDGIYYIDYIISIPGKQGIRKGRNSFVMIHPTGSDFEQKNFLFGICHHAWRFQGEVELAAKVMSSIGIKAIRTGQDRRAVKRPDHSFDFSFYDFQKKIFEKYGLRWMSGFGYPQEWLKTKDIPKTKTKTRKLPDHDEYRSWVRSILKYGGEIFIYMETRNEPELAKPVYYPEKCAEFQKIAYTEAKKINPGIKVITPGFAGARPRPEMTVQNYMEKVLAEAKGSYDIISVHGHDPFAIYQQDIQYLLDMRKRLGIENIPWIAGETAIPSVNLSEYQQGLVLFKKLVYTFANGGIAYFWYDLKNDGYDPLNAEYNFGLFTYDFQPKAAFAVYNTLTGALKEVTFDKNLSADDIFLYRFRSPRQTVYAYWNSSETMPSRMFWIAGKAPEIIDVFGNRRPAPGKGDISWMDITASPEFLRVQGSGELTPGWNLDRLSQSDKTVSASLTFRNPFSRELDLVVDGRKIRIPGKSVKKEKFDRLVPDKSGKIVLPFEVPALDLKSRIVLVPQKEIYVSASGFHSEPDLKLDRLEQMHRTTINAPGMHHLWSGIKDFSAEVFFRKTPSSLIMKCIVTDDIHHQPYKAGNVWRADNLQMLLLFPGKKNFWELGFTCLKDGQSEVFFWSREKQKTPVELIRLKTKRDENKKQTVYEVELPWKAFGLERAPSFVKFNLLFNENDGSVRKLQATVSGSGQGVKDPAKFYILDLSKNY